MISTTTDITGKTNTSVISSSKYCEYASFCFHTCNSQNINDKGFKRFGVSWQLLKVKFEFEIII